MIGRLVGVPGRTSVAAASGTGGPDATDVLVVPGEPDGPACAGALTGVGGGGPAWPAGLSIEYRPAEDAKVAVAASSSSFGEAREDGVSEESDENRGVRAGWRLFFAFALALLSPAGFRFDMSDGGGPRSSQAKDAPREPNVLPHTDHLLGASRA